MRYGLPLRLSAVLSLFAATLSAQFGSRVSGSVVDPSNAPIANATVQLLLPNGGGVVASATTNTEGLFLFSAVNPVTYDVTIDAKGFQKLVLRAVKADASTELALGTQRLEVGTVTEIIEVVAAATRVQTANAEVTTSITNEHFRMLPQLNRSVTALLATQAGVGDNGRQVSTINGLRPSYVNITLDGINIQDNFIRQNTVDFQPNMLLTDQVSEVTLSTSNSSPTTGAGAAQINFSTPSGTNDYHGSLYWTNRNNALAANSWFNNKDGIGLPFLNQNNIGGRIGGPAIKNKLLFYANYEALRNRQQVAVNRTLLTDDARRGIFTYEDTAGNVQRVNLLTATGRSVDPVIRDLMGQLPDASKINNFRVGDSRENLLRNTAGYTFRIRDNRTRDNFTTKLDYILSPSNTLTGSYLWNRDLDDRQDADGSNGFNTAPKTILTSTTHLISAAWRSNPRPAITNEVRFGFNFSSPVFDSEEKAPDYWAGGLLFSNPLVTFMDQGRAVDTWNFMDNASWVKGTHNLQFGFQGMLQRVAPFNDAGIIPTYTLGIGAGQSGVPTAALPGIRAQDVTQANNMLATLAGLLNSYTQTYNVTSRDSGFVSGATNLREFTMDNYSFFVTDNWKVRRNVTLNVGLRYEYLTVMDEKNSLFLQPDLVDGNPVASLFFNNTLNFAGKSAGLPWYKPDRNNFGPNLGLSWDVFGNGKFALRAGYGVNYVNDSHMTAVRNTVTTNAGLSATASAVGLRETLSTRPRIPTPAYKVPRTFEDNWLLSPTSAFGIVDPGLVTPYVQQWNLSVQHEVLGGVLDFRYVGNKVTKALRAFDYNQVVIRENGFLTDFQRAQRNGNLALAAGRGFDPAYNAAIAGSQPLPVFGQLGSQGLLANATVRNLIQTGQVGQLGEFYHTQRLNCGTDSTCRTRNVNFFQNPLSLGLNMMTNYSNQSYNAFQVDWSKRYSKGWLAQFNYTYSKVLSDAAGTEQAQFEPFLDIANGKLERARTPFDLTHALKANFTYELPFGAGKRWGQGKALSRIAGGWALSGILRYQSGNPFSIQSLRATLNRDARSTGQNGTTAHATVDKAQLDELIQFRMTGNGPYFIAAPALAQDGRGVAPDGQPAFNGQVFLNPEAGNVGALQRRMFDGPWWFNFDFGAIKNTKITERHSVEFRMESTNFFNTPTFYLGDQNINSVNFMRITALQTSPRRIQFSLYYRF